MADKAIQLGVKVVDAPMSGGEGELKKVLLHLSLGAVKRKYLSVFFQF